jgi:hypothetical protein
VAKYPYSAKDYTKGGWKMKKSIAFVIMFLVAISFAIAQPFGIKMGMTLDDLIARGCNPRFLGDILIMKLYDIMPPLTHSSFESYSVGINKKYGVVEIFAFGKNIDISICNQDLIDEFNKIKNQISKSYGQSEDYDLSNPDSLLDKGGELVKLLKEQGTILYSIWDSDSGVTLSDDIDHIHLDAKIEDASIGRLILSYSSIRMDDIFIGSIEEEESVF